MAWTSRRITRITLLAAAGAAAVPSLAWLVLGDRAALATLLILLVALVALVTAHALKLRAELDTRYRRNDAWRAIYSVVRPRVPLPAVRSYMATPELLRELVQLIHETRPRVILELGSGISTLLSAYCVESLGEGRVVSLDHEAEFADVTRQALTSHGLSDHAMVLDAPLVRTEVDGGSIPWYSLDNLDKLDMGEIDLLVVDGPPGRDHKFARFPALPRLLGRLSSRAVILVDDARRPDEQEMARRWVRACPDFKWQYIETEKGTSILRRQSNQ